MSHKNNDELDALLNSMFEDTSETETKQEEQVIENTEPEVNPDQEENIHQEDMMDEESVELEADETHTESNNQDSGVHKTKDKRDVKKKTKTAHSKKDKKDKEKSKESPKQEREPARQENDQGGHKNKAPKQKKRRIWPWILSILLIAVLSVGGYFAWDRILSVKAIDFYAMNSITLVGSEGHASYEHDANKIVYPDNKEVETLLKELEISFEPNENLKKGDSVQATILINEQQKETLKEHKVKLKEIEKTFTVEETSKLESFDLMSYVNVSFTTEKGVHKAEASFDKSLENQKEIYAIVKNVAFKPINMDGVTNGDSVKVELDLKEKEEKELLKLGADITSKEKDVTVSGLTVAPKSLEEIDILDKLRDRATEKIASDYAKNQQIYKNFEVVGTCFASDPQNNVNAKDYFAGHGYSYGSVTFIYEFDQQSANGTKKMVDAYGYTNILIKDGKTIEEDIKTMSPFQENATQSSIQEELKQNNFTCGN